MAIAIVEELWTRIRAAIDDKIVAATDARDQAVTAKNAAVAAQTAAEAAAAEAGGGIPAEHTHTVSDITDATAIGQSVVKATTTTAARTAIGAGTSDLAIGTTASTAKAGNYQPTAANITDATTVGRDVLKATDAAAARTAIGAGTSNLALGTTSSTAKAGNYQPTVADITDATTTGRSVLTASSQAAARTAIGAGTSNLALGTTSSTAAAGNHTHTAANITDATTVGRDVLKATDAADARAKIGAGTSNLALGTTSSTAAPGNHTHTKANITDLQTISTSLTYGHIPLRSVDGNITIPNTPGYLDAAASKGYVDGKVAGHTLTNSQLPVPESITGGADLNDYLGTGSYHQRVNTNAASGFNYPPNAIKAGMLEVVTEEYFTYQRYTEYTWGRVFSRVKYMSSWSPWIELVDKAYVNARTPDTRVVSALPASPTAGVVYLVTG